MTDATPSEDQLVWACRYCNERIGTGAGEPDDCPTCGNSAWNQVVDDRDTDRSSPDSHSELWVSSRDEVESYGSDWETQRYESLHSLGLNTLRKAAAVLDIPTDKSRDEIAQSLTDVDCFRGPIGDETVYQEREANAVPIIGKRGVLGHKEWKRFDDETDTND